MFKEFSLATLVIALLSLSTIIAPRSTEAQLGCSQQEQQLLIKYYQAIMQAAYLGDINQAVQLAQSLEQSISPACSAALARAQAYSQSPGYGQGYGTQRAPSVLDHGGGTYSVPGVGACGPSGCMSLD